MPPLRLTSLVQGVLPNVSATSRAVLSTLACRNGYAPPAGEVAAWVGLRDRFQLARALRADGLPPLEQLAGWIRVLHWVLEAESTGAALLEITQRDGIDPATAYRLVRRVTGLRWSEVRRQGASMILLKLRDRCSARVVGARVRVAPQPARLDMAVGDGVTRRPEPRPAPVGDRGHPAGVLAGRLQLGGTPFDVVTGGPGTAYVTRLHSASVERIRLEPLMASGSIRVGAVPTRIVINPAEERAYVTNQFTDDISILDLGRWRGCGSISVPGSPLGAVLAPDGHTLYIVTNLDRL
jgi:hypothetical protein